jgi:hypothetical protein
MIRCSVCRGGRCIMVLVPLCDIGLLQQGYCIMDMNEIDGTFKLSTRPLCPFVQPINCSLAQYQIPALYSTIIVDKITLTNTSFSQKGTYTK